MTTFINRRSITNRRNSDDRRKAPRLDLSYRRRRKTDARRDCGRSLVEDFNAKQTINHDHNNIHHRH